MLPHFNTPFTPFTPVLAPHLQSFGSIFPLTAFTVSVPGAWVGGGGRTPTSTSAHCSTASALGILSLHKLPCHLIKPCCPLPDTILRGETHCLPGGQVFTRLRNFDLSLRTFFVPIIIFLGLVVFVFNQVLLFIAYNFVFTCYTLHQFVLLTKSSLLHFLMGGREGLKVDRPPYKS